MKQTIFAAQGPGFYGVAVVTVPLSIADVLDQLRNASLNVIFDSDASCVSVGVGDGFAYFRQVGQEVQVPEPTVIFDSGHGTEDLETLRTILYHLKF